MFGISRGTVSKVMVAVEKEKKTSQQSKSLPESLKLSERDRRTLHGIVRKNRRNKALKITSELNEHPQNQFSTKSCNSKTYALKNKCFKAFRVVYDQSELVS